MANEEQSAEVKIYNRLAQAPSFHPAGAKLFVDDWTLEPGDVVTVQSDGEDYSVPIYSLDLTWNGQSRVDIQSTGNQKREPLSALRRKEYSVGRRSYGLSKQIEEVDESTRQQYEHYTEESDAYRKEIYRVNGVVYDSDGNIVYQTDPVTGEIIYDDAGNPIPVYNEQSNGSISGQVIQSAQRMATIIKQSGTVLEVFDATHQYYEGDRVLYPDENGNVYRFITDHNPGAWKGTGEHGDVEAVGTLQTQIDQNTTGILTAAGEITDIDGRVRTIEGSTLWNDEDEIVNIVGSVSVNTQSGQVVINDGYGLYTNDNGTYYGVWDAGNLTAGVIVQTINGTTETIISADKVNLEGYVTASYVDATILTVSQLTSNDGYIGNIKASNINTGGNVVASGAVIGSGLYIGTTAPYESVANAVKSIIKDTSPPEGTIGFKYNTLGNSTYQSVNFNIADTAYYQSHVGIAANGVSVTGGTTEEDYEAYNDLQVDAVTVDSDGYYIVAATAKNGNHAYSKFHVPQSQATTPLVTKGTWSNGQITFTAGTTGTATASVALGINVASVEDQQTPNRHARVTVNDSSSPTGETQELYLTYTSWDYPSAHQRRIQLRSGSTSGSVVAYADVDATDMYEDGWGDAEDICEPPLEYSGTAEKTNFSVQIPSSTVGNSTTYDFTIGQETPSASNKWAYVNYSNSGTDSLVAKINVSGWYTAGQGSVSAVLNAYTGTIPSETTPFSLSTGNYGLYLIKDGTTETDPISYYNVPSGRSITYVVSSTGEPIPIFTGLTVVGRLYPNTDVTVGSGTDQLGRRQISYNGRSGYVGNSSLSSTKGSTNYTGHIGWTDELEPGASRSVSSLSEVVLSSSDTGESTHSVDVTYDDGNTEIGGATITIDASAISGGGGGGSGGVDYVSKYQESDDSDDWASWDEALQDKITLNSDGTYAYLKVHANDGSVYNLGINASAVYQKGKSDGSGQVVYGSISNLALYTDSTTGHTLEYNETTKLYTAHIEVTGTNISNAPYHQNLNISGSAAYLQGKREGGAANVTISSISGTDIGNPSTNVNPGTIVATASNGNTGSEYLYLTQGNWNSNNRKAVNIRVGSTNGPLIARTWIDAPSGSHDITAGSVSVQTGSTSGRKSAGSISGQSVYNARNSGYIFFTASCGGTNQGFYISINA